MGLVIVNKGYLVILEDTVVVDIVVVVNGLVVVNVAVVVNSIILYQSHYSQSHLSLILVV